MKIFLGINKTDKKNLSIYQGEDFVAKELSQETAKALDEVSGKVEELGERASLPKGLKIAFYVFAAIFGILVIGIIRAVAKGTSLETGYQNAPYLFWIAGGAGVVTLGLFLYGKYRFGKVSQESETQYIATEYNVAVENAIREINAPANAVRADFLSFVYVIKNDKISIKAGFDSINQTMEPIEFDVYRQGENLCIADMRRVFEIPLAKITKISTINKKVFLTGWNKGETPKSDKYKQYKIQIVQSGLTIKTYHILHIDHNGEEIRMYFPCYELPVIQQLTGIDKIEEEN